MAAYLAYLSGFVAVAAWWFLQRRLSPRAWLGWWWLGLLLHMNFPAALVARILFRVHFPYAALATPNALAISRWLGAVLILRVLLDMTLRNRSRGRWQYLFGAGFAASLLVAPWFGPVSRTLLLLLNPLHFDQVPKFVVAVFAVPWLWSFRWREHLRARWVLVAAATALLSLLAVNTEFAGGQKIGMTMGAEFGMEGENRWMSGSGGLKYFARQALDVAILYTLMFLVSLLDFARLAPRRVGRRLAVSHLLAAVPPVGLALVFLVLWTTLFLATHRSETAEHAVRDASEALGARLGKEVASGRGTAEPAIPREHPGLVVLLREEDGAARVLGARFPDQARDSLLAVADTLRRTPLALVEGTLYLHARLDTTLDGRRISVVALDPVDSLFMDRVGRIVGAPAKIHPGAAAPGFGAGSLTFSDQGGSAPSIGPSPRERWRIPGGCVISCLRWNEGRIEPASVPLSSSAALAEPILAFGQGMERGNFFAFLVLEVLWLIGVLLLLPLWGSVRMAFGVARSIGRTTAALTRATRSIAAGDFGHRIRIEGRDELWSIAESFNDMAGKLEAMREMERRALRLEKELEIARKVQQSLFPRELPRPAGWQLAAACRPAREVGGDYYDVFAHQDDLVFALGDVSGKGLGPSLLMSNVQATVRGRLRRRETPLPSLFDELNQQLLESASPGMFITLFVGVADTRTGRLRYVNGGHNAPVLLPAPGAEPVALGGGGLIVGILPGSRWDEAEVEMRPGSALFVYSDGITEAVNEAGEMYEECRLTEVLRASGRLDAPALLAGTFESVDRFRGRAEQADDMSAVVVERRID